MKKISCVALICVAIASANCSSTPAKPSQVVIKYYQLVDKGDFEAAFKLLSKKQINGQGGPNFAKGLVVLEVGAIHDNGGMKSVQIMKENVFGNSAEITAKLFLGNGKSDEMDLKLSKEDNEWKIDEM